MGPDSTLEQLVQSVRGHPGVRNKAPIALVSDVLGPADWYEGPGDDGAVVHTGDATLVVGGEALWPPFVEADPEGAGVAAVLTNVNDLAAMGARPLAVVDTIVGSEMTARKALEGMRFASNLYQVPVVGGHLTLRDGPPAISAFGLGTAERVLSARHAEAGQALIVACVTDGTMREDFAFFRSFDERGVRLGGDVRVLAQVAADGSCAAAKDVSMAGLVGSLVTLLEYSQLGVTLDLDAVPKPVGVSMGTWLTAFPCFAFLLCAPAGREEDCMHPFRDRGVEASVVGVLDGSGQVRLRKGGRSVTAFELRTESVTGLSSADLVPPPSA
jgi:selenophosphate synthetase-related protein